MTTMLKFGIAALILVCPASTVAQKMTAKVMDRQNHEVNYTYTFPASFYSTTNMNTNCSIGDTYANCSGSGTSSGVVVPPQPTSYNFTGATLALQLQDGRGMIVNCVSKFAEKMRGAAGNHRDCRVPTAEEIQVEFHGDDAKLIWLALDGKKTETETYKVMAVLNKPVSHETGK
jgi:hypothetical protein